MRYLLDTDICVYAMAGSFSALRVRLAQCEPGDIVISTITLSEVVLGSARGMAPPPDVLEAFLRQMELLPYDGAAARTYAGLPFRRGRFDRLIAAHALSLDLTIVTNNEADFADMPGLRFENWTLPL